MYHIKVYALSLIAIKNGKSDIKASTSEKLEAHKNLKFIEIRRVQVHGYAPRIHNLRDIKTTLKQLRDDCFSLNELAMPQNRANEHFMSVQIVFISDKNSEGKGEKKNLKF
jgi:hypothetical protein